MKVNCDQSALSEALGIVSGVVARRTPTPVLMCVRLTASDGRLSMSATDTEALDAFKMCSRFEGIIPALEPAHAMAFVGRIAGDLPKDHIICMNMCGRGDKDIYTLAEPFGQEI